MRHKECLLIWLIKSAVGEKISSLFCWVLSRYSLYLSKKNRVLDRIIVKKGVYLRFLVGLTNRRIFLEIFICFLPKKFSFFRKKEKSFGRITNFNFLSKHFFYFKSQLLFHEINFYFESKKLIHEIKVNFRNKKKYKLY